MTTLDTTQQRRIADQLRSMRHHLLAQIEEHMHETESQTGLDLRAALMDEGDISVSEHILDMTLEKMDRESEQLREVYDAESRLSNGNYGVCVDCASQISSERLLVEPTASRCCACEERYEGSHWARSAGPSKN